jgi:hypothetical protein
MQRVVLFLSVLAPVLLVASYVLYLPYTILLEQVSRAHLANEIGSATLITPVIAVVAAWLVGLVDTARRRLWGWFALILLVPLIGALIYGIGGPREATASIRGFANIAVSALGVLALVTLLASYVIPLFSISVQPQADQRLLDIFALGFAVIGAVIGVIGSLRGGQNGAALLFGLLGAIGLAQLILGASYLTDQQLPEGNVPGLTQTFFGVTVAEPIGYLATGALAAALALTALFYASQLSSQTPTPQQAATVAS